MVTWYGLPVLRPWCVSSTCHRLATFASRSSMSMGASLSWLGTYCTKERGCRRCFTLSTGRAPPVSCDVACRDPDTTEAGTTRRKVRDDFHEGRPGGDEHGRGTA